MHWMLSHKWELLVFLETIAWVFTFLMFYALYKIRSTFWFKVFTGIAVVSGWVPHLTLSMIHIAKTGEIGWFDVTIFLLLLYGVLFGKKHVNQIDRAMKKRFE